MIACALLLQKAQPLFNCCRNLAPPSAKLSLRNHTCWTFCIAVRERERCPSGYTSGHPENLPNLSSSRGSPTARALPGPAAAPPPLLMRAFRSPALRGPAAPPIPVS